MEFNQVNSNVGDVNTSIGSSCLCWTNTPPTQLGFYWLKCDKLGQYDWSDRGGYKSIVQILSDSQYNLWVSYPGCDSNDNDRVDSIDGLWAGPISEPMYERKTKYA